MPTVGEGTVEIRPDMDGFGRDVSRGIDDSSGAVQSSFGKLAKVMGGALAAAGAVAFGKDLLDLGTQTEVFRNKAKTVFEGNNADVQKWAKENAASFGVTDDKLSGLAANFGDLLKPMGFTAKAAADMSTEVVGLSGALSAWSGGQRTASEVSEILASAMLGERDALKGLGISISEADVKTRLAVNGAEKLTGAALQQATAVATQQLIFEKSTDAQKAWSDGSFDAIKKQNALKEKIAELKEDLADKLLPAFAAVTAWVVDKFIPGMERLVKAVAPAFKEIGAAAGDLFDAMKPVFEFIGDNLKPILIGLAVVFAPVYAAVGLLIAAFVKFPVIGETVAKVVDYLTEQFGNLVDYVKKIWPQISEAIGHVIDVVKGIIRTFVDVVSALWRAWGDDILRLAKAAFEFVRESIDNVLQVIRGVIQTVLAIINGDWGKAWEGIKGILSGIWDQIKNIVSLAIDSVKAYIGGVLSAIRLGWDTAWNGLSSALSDIWEGIKTVVQGGIRFVVDKILAMAGTILDAATFAFGWVPGLGPKLEKASRDFDRFRDDVNRSLGLVKDKEVKITFKSFFDAAQPSNVSAGGGFGGRRAHGGPVTGGRSYLVGEEGPELLRMGSANGRVDSNPDLMRALSGSSSSSTTTNYYITAPSTDAEEIVRAQRHELAVLALLAG